MDDFQVGDLVVCECVGNVWYRGLPGVIIDFDGPRKTPCCLLWAPYNAPSKIFIELLNESR